MSNGLLAKGIKMYRSRIFLSVNLTSLLLISNAAFAATQNLPTHHKLDASASTTTVDPENHNKSFFYISLLYIQPNADNLKYATYVSGIQPYYQSWHYQAINPVYHPAFELGYSYAFKDKPYSASIYWLHLNSNDSDNKQAATGTDLTTVEFVAPPFEMSPPVFGIKHVDSRANFVFDNILLNISKSIDYGPQLQTQFFGGISILNLNETVNTTFSDYVGSPATPYSYATPPDPLYSFQLQNTSRFLGAGPNVGFGVQYETTSGFGVLGQVMGSLSVGTIKTQDDFYSASTRLKALGITTSHQQITAPNSTQVVFGADGKLGAFYHFHTDNLSRVTIEAGYRMAAFLNAIATVNPSTLVQPGTVTVTPEFATGTMAIVSTDTRSRAFSYNGPFIDMKISI